MKKLFLFVTGIVMLQVFGFCQTQYVFIDFKDAKRPGLQSSYNYSDKTVSNAIDNKMNKMGYKGKETKGFTMYKSVLMPELGSQSYDLYFSVDKKSKRDKDNSMVTMLISSGNENFITDSANHQLMNNGKAFLDSLNKTIVAYDLEQQIASQDDVVKKAEKKYKSLTSDGDDLQKKKKKLEQDIDDNIKDQKNQQAEIEKQRQLLETLKARQTK